MKKKPYRCPAYLYITYHLLKFSRPKIAKECCVSSTTILSWMRKHKISRRDISESLKGRVFDKKWKENISKSKRGKNHPNYGKKHSEITKKRMSFSLSNEKNPAWKGNNAGYKAIHLWVQKNKLKSEVCEICGKRKNHLELANKSGEYKRDINDFMWLCKPCHINFDKNQNRWGKSLEQFKEVIN